MERKALFLANDNYLIKLGYFDHQEGENIGLVK